MTMGGDPEQKSTSTTKFCGTGGQVAMSRLFANCGRAKKDSRAKSPAFIGCAIDHVDGVGRRGFEDMLSNQTRVGERMNRIRRRRRRYGRFKPD